MSLSTNVKYGCLRCLYVHVILRTRSVPNHYFWAYQILFMAISDTKLRNIHGKSYSGLQEVAAADGLSARISPKGVIQFQYRYRLHGKPHRLGIGRYPSVSWYGFDIRGISVQSVDEAYVFQALWHTTIDNCTSAACRIGMHFWGQNVSNHVSGCHMRRTQLSQLSNSFGYLINPRAYAYAPGVPKRSEAIIIDGESMAIGFDTGIRLTDDLDMHFSNLDLDYCWKYGVSIANVNTTFTLTDSWVAADATNTGQFIGVHVTTPPWLVKKKVFSSIYFSCTNANALNNNIAINLRSVNDYVTRSDLTVNNGKYSVFARYFEQCLVQNSVLFAEIYLDAYKDWSISDIRVSGLTEINKPSGSFNNYCRTTYCKRQRIINIYSKKMGQE